MATEITCIVPDPSDPGNRIEHVGGPNWLKGEKTVIAEIEEGREYFVQVDSTRVPVLVIERSGERYLRTDPVETSRNRLPLLPSCPI